MIKKFSKVTLGIVASVMITVPVMANEAILSEDIVLEESSLDAEDEVIDEQTDELCEDDVLLPEETLSEEEAEDEAIIEESDEAYEEELSVSDDSYEEAVNEDGLSGKAGTNVTYSIVGDTMTLSGYGSTARFNNDEIKNVKSSIRHVVIGNGINSICYRLFYEFENLETVKMAGSVKTIEQNAFYGCSSLRSIEIPEGVTSLGWGAIEKCTSLESVTIPSTCTTIGRYAFNGDISLKSVYIKDGLQDILGDAFYGCKSLERINIPKSVGQENISNSAFKECEKLKTFGPTGGNYNIQTDNVYRWYVFPYVESVVISGKAVSIPEKAFAYCDALETVTIQSGIKTIGSNAFYECKSLRSITIPKGVTSIGWGAVEKCTALESVKIPSTVTSIGEYAFNGDISLKSVYIEKGLQTIKHNAFSGCKSLERINIPRTVGQDDIAYDAFKECERLKTFGPTGGKYNVQADNAYKYYRFPYVESVVISGKTVNIPEKAFAYCDSLRKVTIQSGVKTIGSNAFYECKNLSSITLPKGLTSIGWGAIEKCTALTKITIPSTVKTIGDYAFNGDVSLKTVNLNEGLNKINSNAFYGCQSLKKIYIPNSVKEIGYNAFYNCANGFRIYACKKSAAETYAKDKRFRVSNVCTIKYVANGGSGDMNTQYVAYNKAGKLAKPSFTRKGYKFKGWCEKKNGKGKIYKAGTKINKLQKNKTYYAIWKK